MAEVIVLQCIEDDNIEETGDKEVNATNNEQIIEIHYEPCQRKNKDAEENKQDDIQYEPNEVKTLNNLGIKPKEKRKRKSNIITKWPLRGSNKKKKGSKTSNPKIKSIESDVDDCDNNDDMDDVGKEKKVYGVPCTECDKMLSTMQGLRRHMKRIHSIELDKDESGKSHQFSHNCPCCDVVVHTMKALKQHIKSYHEGEYHFPCGVCGRKFITPSRMRDHARRAHNSARKHVCEQCGKDFKDLQGLKRHTLCHHSQHRDFTCEICSSQFKMKYSLVLHLKKYHNYGDQQFACEMCKRVFMSQRNLERHKETVHFAKIVGTCEECGKSFTKESHLESHNAVVHGDERNFKCETCGAAFKRKGQLVAHIKMVHECERNFICEVEGCEKAYKKSSHLKDHIRSIHDKPVDPSTVYPNPSKPFSCDICGTMFKRKSQIGEHIKSVHLNERKYQCPVDNCDKIFKKSSHVKGHIKSVHGDCINTSPDTTANGIPNSIDLITNDINFKVPVDNTTDTIPKPSTVQENSQVSQTKSVLMTTNGHVSHLSSFDALRALHSFIYEREQIGRGTQFFIDIRHIYETESGESLQPQPQPYSANQSLDLMAPLELARRKVPHVTSNIWYPNVEFEQ